MSYSHPITAYNLKLVDKSPKTKKSSKKRSTKLKKSTRNMKGNFNGFY